MHAFRLFRHWLRQPANLCLWMMFPGGVLLFSAAGQEPPNIILIVIDDLNDYVGCLGGHPSARTPHIDALAEEGVLFTNAHCNAPVCNPSRASLWTGLRPTTTGITTNPSGFFRDQPEWSDVVTLPQALANAGYATTGFGKLFHLGHGNRTGSDWQQQRSYGYGPLLNDHLHYREGDRLSDWGVPPSEPEVRRGKRTADPTAASFDEDLAVRVVEFLGDRHSRPFLLGCGFFRPHTPLYAREEWFERFPAEEVSLPALREDDRNDLPYFGRRPRREKDIEAPGLWNHEWVVENGHWREIVRAYLASTASVDAQVGRVVNALRGSPYAGNTWIMLFSDHGWHLGEKDHWGKAALWEQTTRVPFIVTGPGIPRGVRIDEPVELLDVYPTVAELAGIAAPHDLEGASLLPLLRNPESEWPHDALTTFSDHHALRTKRWRYIRYVDGSEELYDHASDPHEWTNLATTGLHTVLPELRIRMDAILGR